MSKIFLIFVFLAQMFVAPAHTSAQDVIVPRISATLSKEDLRKMVEKVVTLSRELQTERDAAVAENAGLIEENKTAKLNLSYAQIAHEEALQKSDTLQQQVNAVTEDRNAQAKAKDEALDQVDKLSKENKALQNHLSHLKVVICLEAVALAVFLLLRFGILTLLPPPYNWIAMIAGPAAIYGLVWLLI